MMIARAPARKPLWLMTLADLALLLMGFFVFLQATGRQGEAERQALAAGIRDGFDNHAPLPPAPMALAANIVAGFAPASAEPPSSLAPLLAWARAGASDPRTTLLVTGYADGTVGDVRDGSALALASARAAAVAGALERSGVARSRIRTAGQVSPVGRRVTVTISFGS